MSGLPVHFLAHPELQIKELRIKDERKEERKEDGVGKRLGKKGVWKRVGEERKE